MYFFDYIFPQNIMQNKNILSTDTHPPKTKFFNIFYPQNMCTFPWDQKKLQINPGLFQRGKWPFCTLCEKIRASENCWPLTVGHKRPMATTRLSLVVIFSTAETPAGGNDHQWKQGRSYFCFNNWYNRGTVRGAEVRLLLKTSGIKWFPSFKYFHCLRKTLAVWWNIKPWGGGIC